MKVVIQSLLMLAVMFASSSVYAIDVYSYNNTSGEYVGYTTAGLDPRETIAQGIDIPLVPEYATLLAPPVPGENQVVMFESEVWVLKSDYRGTLYHTDSDHSNQTITVIGELPADAILGEYQKTEAELLVDARNLKLAELSAGFSSRTTESVTCSAGGADYDMATDLDDVFLLDGGVRLATKLSQTDMLITDYDGVDHTVSLTDADIINICQAVNFATIRQTRNTLVAQAKLATLVELDTIIW